MRTEQDELDIHAPRSVQLGTAADQLMAGDLPVIATARHLRLVGRPQDEALVVSRGEIVQRLHIGAHRVLSIGLGIPLLRFLAGKKFQQPDGILP